MSTLCSDLAAEIAELESELNQAIQAAARAKLHSADHEAAFFSERLKAKKQELQNQQAAEAQADQERQHAQQLVQLVTLEKEISRTKLEVNTLRAMIAELPAKLSMAEYQLNLLLRSHAQLKQEIQS